MGGRNRIGGRRELLGGSQALRLPHPARGDGLAFATRSRCANQRQIFAPTGSVIRGCSNRPEMPETHNADIHARASNSASLRSLSLICGASDCRRDGVSC